MPSKNEMATTMTRDQAARAGVLDIDGVRASVTSNFRRLYGFTDKILPSDLPTEPKVYIYSVSEYGDIVDLGPGFPKFNIHPCPDGEEYGKPCVLEPIYFFKEAKVDQIEHTFHSGNQVRDAILKVGPGMNAAWDRRKVGWFASDSEPPRREEVKRAIDIYTTECKVLLQAGERFYRANKLDEINETHRRAVKFLREKVDWDKAAIKMVDCPGCGERVREGVIWHATPHGCGYVFDMARYKAHFPGKPVPVQDQPPQ